MKFLHCSDLHLGIRPHEMDLTADQQDILEKIVAAAQENQVDAVLVAGDVYDRSQPNRSAVNLLDDFITRLAAAHIPAYFISGNHDSPDRLNFGNRLLEVSGIHLASVFSGNAVRYDLQDEYGPLHLWALPFVRPSAVRAAFPEAEITDYTTAVQVLVDNMELNTDERNLLMAHQFVTNGGRPPVRSDSEIISVGNLDNVDARVLEPFDYVALGHIHTPQNVGSEKVRYCGTPLVYSGSECGREKTLTLVELKEKGELTVTELPVVPLHPVRRIQGELQQLLDSGSPSEDYIYATLTDDPPRSDGLAQLRAYYPNLMKLELRPHKKGEASVSRPELERVAHKSTEELFTEFFQKIHGREMTVEELEFMRDALGEEAEA